MPKKKKNKWTRISKKKKPVDTFHLQSVELPSIPQQDDCNVQSATTHNTHGKHFDLKNPMVYTQRLDEMKVVLNPKTVTDHASFFEQILAESKPKVTDDSLKHLMTHDRKSGGPMAYVKLKYKIDRVNINIAHKKILLERKQNTLLQKSTPDSEFDNRSTIVNDVKKPNNPKSYAKKEKYTKTVESTVKDSTTPIYRNNYIIITNQKTNEADVYYLNNTGMVIQHYRTDNGRHNFFQSSPNTALIPYCCWYKRQDIVTSMLLHVSAIAVRCMGAAHRCEGRCTCCCRNLIQTYGAKAKTSEESTPEKRGAVSEEAANTDPIEVNSEIIVTPAPLNVLIDNMLNKSPSVPLKSSLIQKAFTFIPREKTKPRTPNTNLNFVAGTQILFSYKDGNEYYKIGPGCVISQHFRNVSQAFIEEHVVSDKKAISKKICCWFARHRLIHAWRNSKILPSNYMRTRHTCSLDKCVCCCEPIKLSGNNTSNNLKKLSLPDIPNYTTEVCTKLSPLRFNFATHEPLPIDDIIPVDDISPVDNQAETNNHKTKDPNTNINDPPVENTVADAVSENKNEDDKNVGEKRMLICLNTKLLLEKTLVKLKNVSVQFNRRDKITAILNVPVTNLNTDELRTLSGILTQAQKDIDALKQTHSGVIMDNPCNPTGAVPTNLNRIINEREKNLQNRLRFTARNHLYSAFSNWSSLHNVEFLKSFKSFVNGKIRKLRTKAIKRRNSRCLVIIPTKKRNVAKTPQQTKQLSLSKRTHKKTKTKKLSPTNSFKSQADSKILKAALQGIEDTKKSKIQNEPGPSDDPLDITSFDSIAEKPFKSKGLPLTDIENPLKPVEDVIPIYDSSDQDEGVIDELPTLPIEIVCTAQVNDDDCILGA